MSGMRVLASALLITSIGAAFPKYMHRTAYYARYLCALVLLLIAPAPEAQVTGCPAGVSQLIVYHAGSLTTAFKALEQRFTADTGVCVVDVAGGSVDTARQVTAGKAPCDIFASADDQVIELLLKPGGYADYSIRFAEGAMVLAYTTSSRNAATIARSGAAFAPPDIVPDAAADWHVQIAKPGVVVGGSHPFLDPSGYRADMIFQLAEAHYQVPGLYNALLARYAINKPSDVLGKTYDYQLIYEHSAAAAAKADATGTYRYARLPDAVALSAGAMDARYGARGTTIPGLQLDGKSQTVRVPASRVTWGLTILSTAPHGDNAVHFLQWMFSSEGAALQRAAGPTPINPPETSADDYRRLPPVLRAVVRVRPEPR